MSTDRERVKIMRIGGSVLKKWSTAKEWIGLVKELGYSAVIFPVDCNAPKELIHELRDRIYDEGIVIGEVGVWKNLMSQDPDERENVLDYSIRQLELAEAVGANCCVNVSGSCGHIWDGYHPDNYNTETRDLIICQTRKIIDAVCPSHTAYSLEPMPWMLPDSPDSYLDLIRDVDRESFGVHLDFCNMVNSLERYHRADVLIEECFEKLGPYIRSIHIKDCRIDDYILPFCIAEKRVGEGNLDLSRVLQQANRLDADIPLFTEHLDTHEDYVYSTEYLKKLANTIGLSFR